MTRAGPPGDRQGAGLPRRAVLGLGLTAALGLAAPALASRSNPVELLVGAPPGSKPDLWARGVAPFLERALPRLTLAVRNHPGRGGLDSVAVLAEADPARRVIGVVTAPLLLARAVEGGEPFPATRIAPLAAVLEENMVLVGAPDGPRDIAALRALGDRGTLGTPAPGSAAHFAASRLDGRLDLPRFAFPTATAARQAAAAGHVAAALLPLPDAITQLREGRLHGIGIAAARRSALLPEVATLREQEVDLIASAQRGFALHPAAPAPFRAALLRGLEAVAADPDFAEQCAARGQNPRFIGPEDWTGLLARVDTELRRRWAEEPWLPRRA
ncbi:tripartite tricarboxylate transporter substrate-binding protein [Falsiroseomonas sp.]|uniref:tripartite tricarboxylate transporter substrate-binding protein n=1 Tax=Falsiroseomonas sp. TaxID=2870721 RepID=UPI002736C580|nr:tripartite tricarboxylate transporter substrate-binding protein [Falsiroseomonas sp.]MDP3419097.1 tripartite tricarboxylate transporter substrate-binding protein [Falsiroseomonas sp.]